MEWFKKNSRYIIMALAFLLVLKFVQSCNRGMALDTQEKNHTEVVDSITLMYEDQLLDKDIYIDSLIIDNMTKDFLNVDLKAELKIAGVKYNEANKRADAVQKTAESVKANTTIEIKGAEKDTTNIN